MVGSISAKRVIFLKFLLNNNNRLIEILVMVVTGLMLYYTVLHLVIRSLQ